MAVDYIHLKVHSDYSLSEGLIVPEDVPVVARHMDMPAVALTDCNNCFMLHKFYNAALANGVKPIIGAELAVARRGPSGTAADGRVTAFPLTVLARNEQGRQNLFELLSKAWREGRRNDSAVIYRDWLNADNTAGLIVLSGAQQGEIGRALVHGNDDRAAEFLQDWKQLFGDDFFLELMRIGLPQEQVYLNRALELASALDCPVVATNKVCFLSRDDFELHETRVCIGSGEKLDDKNRRCAHTPQQYFRSSSEMMELFADVPEALKNSVEIARRCNVRIKKAKDLLPRYPNVPDDCDEMSFLREESAKGLELRLQGLELEPAEQELYRQRLQHELEVIEETGYAGYFLIVMDFVCWARRQEIPVGPGRGSGVGSLVAWALEITDVNPVRYGLIFERFLNPERVGMPDFDIDFCQERRDEVISYVADKYGYESVAGIITFSRLGPRAVLRDVTRVQNKAYMLGEALAKQIPAHPAATLKDALEPAKNPNADKLKQELRAAVAQEIWQAALELEGKARNPGRHAGGIVIAPDKLTKFMPLYSESSDQSAESDSNQTQSMLITQYDKNDLEKCGLVKFDFLGLRTLTVIQKALNLLSASYDKDKLPTTTRIPLADEEVFSQLSAGHSTAVFQMESRGMRELLLAFKPSCFEDLIALISLYRPGPLELGMHNDYIERKHQRKRYDCFHPMLEPVLKETYGVFVYQEQVMECARIMAGYTAGGADLLRRAMGKKDPVEMAQHRDTFVSNAVAAKVERKLAKLIFDQMESFAGYGFNKSHATAYALLAYHTMWLKVHHPVEYLTAELSIDMEKTDRFVPLFKECKRLNIEVLPPDINSSNYEFSVELNQQQKPAIRYGLGAIKSVGKHAAETIVANRQEQGEYTNQRDLCFRISSKVLNRNALKALVNAGCLDGICEPSQPRHVLAATSELMQQMGGKHQENQESCSQELFGSLGGQVDSLELDRDIEPWDAEERAAREYEALGIYLREHPLKAVSDKLFSGRYGRIAALNEGMKCRLLVLVELVRFLGNVVVVVLNDGDDSIDLMIGKEKFNRYEEELTPGKIVSLEAKVEIRERSGELKLNNPTAIKEQKPQTSRGYLSLKLRAQQFDAAKADRIAELLEAKKGGKTRIRLQFLFNDRAEAVELEQSRVREVMMDNELLAELHTVLGHENVDDSAAWVA